MRLLIHRGGDPADSLSHHHLLGARATRARRNAHVKLHTVAPSPYCGAGRRRRVGLRRSERDFSRFHSKAGLTSALKFAYRVVHLGSELSAGCAHGRGTIRPRGGGGACSSNSNARGESLPPVRADPGGVSTFKSAASSSFKAMPATPPTTALSRSACRHKGSWGVKNNTRSWWQWEPHWGAPV